MKKTALLFWLVLYALSGQFLYAQVPGMFNYQGVARDAEGNPLADRLITVRVGVEQGISPAALLWEEEHSVQTSPMGLFTLRIGDPSATKSGGTLADFDQIDWAAGNLYLHVRINDGSGYADMGTAPFLSVPYALLADKVVNNDDADADPLNEIQTLELNGNQISISGGNTIVLPTGEIDLDADPTNELQLLTLTGDQLEISGTNSVTIPDASATNEIQSLSLSGSSLSISGANSVALPDVSATNEIQNLSLSGANLGISGGSGVTLPDASATNEIQSLSLSGSSLSISGANSVTLPDASATNEIQNLSLSGASLGISGGSGVTLPDASATNELNTAVTFSGTTLTVTDAGGARSADLSSLADYWQKNGDSIFYLPGNVGIGTPVTGSRLSVMGYGMEPEEPLFEVKRKDGQTVFAVYNEGVRVYVEDVPGKGTKGGFAVGGYTSNKGVTQEYLRVTPDSVRIYVDDGLLAKGTKGGFAVGGFHSNNKAPGYEYLRVTHDSVRVYINQPQAKGAKGGFAVGGYTNNKGAATNYMDMTPDNYFIGHEAGNAISGGLYNNFIGYQSGYSNTIGNNNSFIGYQSGKSHQTGDVNTFVGNLTGAGNTGGTGNVLIGNAAGQNFTSGSANTFMGTGAGSNFQNGNYNIFIGALAGAGYQFPAAVTGGQNNAVIGTFAGYRLNTGSDNLFLGNFSGLFTTSGSNNVFEGYQSGYSNSTGSNNIFIGTQAGYSNTTAYYNVFVGTRSGLTNSTGFENTFMGYESGYANSTGAANTFVGTNAGRSNTTGYSNTFLGRDAGRNNQGGYWNLFSGIGAGQANLSGAYNTYLGWIAGYANTGGFGNVMVGGSSGVAMTTGDDNVLLGSYSGYALTSGSGNVFLGSYAGSSETSTNNKLYVENSSANSSSALIYGDFSTDYLRLNANVDIRNTLRFPNSGAVIWVGGSEALWYNGTYFSWGFGGTYNYFGSRVTIGNTANPGYMLYVQGTGASSGGWTTVSDARFKTNIRSLGDVLPDLEKVRGVYYNWRREEHPEMDFNDARQIGFIAQEVEKVYPEMVTTDEKGYKSVDYSKMTVVLLEAVKEQQTLIDEQNKRIEKLESDQKQMLELLKNLSSGNESAKVQ
ncbi:MAG: tail fiber domain-containing protein [Bacteroidota bacterium]